MDPNYVNIVVIEEVEEEEEEEEEEEDEGGGDDEEEEADEEEEEEDAHPVDVNYAASNTAPVRVSESQSVEHNQKKRKPTSEGGESDVLADWNPDESDGLFCPICMDTWTSGGDHQICCLPCGHLYGMSCIKKWLTTRGSRRKCPQCNKKCALKDVRLLYASRVAAFDEQLQQKVHNLEAKCAALAQKDVDWCKKEKAWRKKETDLCMQVQQLKERTQHLEGLLEDGHWKPSKISSVVEGGPGLFSEQGSFGAEVGHQGHVNGFILLKDWRIGGARLFDVDVFGQTMVIAQTLSGVGGSHALTKISLLAPHDRESIQLLPCIKAVKDLRVSPHSRLALLASLGKKLTVVSTESNNMVLAYDLPTAAWSCTWDLHDSHYMYAGLQNGMVLEFDMRQTSKPVESVVGLARNPVHTIHSLSPDSSLGSGTRSILTASSAGLCHWNFGNSGERSFLIPESGNQGVCISLACGHRSGDIVASFRPKIEMAGDNTALSQLPSTPSSSLSHTGAQGAHVLYKRVDSMYEKIGSTCASVSNIRLPKLAVVDRGNQNSLFAAEDEATHHLVLQELPYFMGFQSIQCRRHPVRDLKFSKVQNVGLLGCLSEDSLQLYSLGQ